MQWIKDKSKDILSESRAIVSGHIYEKVNIEFTILSYGFNQKQNGRGVLLKKNTTCKIVLIILPLIK